MSDFIHGSFFEVFPSSTCSPRTDFDRIDLAPDGFLGIQCEHGHFAVPSHRGFAEYRYYRDWHHCAAGDVAPTMRQRAVLQRRDVQFVIEGWEARLLSTVWWHSTSNELHIDPEQDDRFLHIGSRQAAIDNEPRISMSATSFYLYQVKIKSDLPVDRMSPDVFVERHASRTFEELIEPSTHALHRYVNVREDPGSVSLLICPSAIDSVTLDTVKSAPHWDRPKYVPRGT